jgi:6-pyruvoyltetrahydropterin/6-carboxytetrahydropterin synthase
MYKISKRMEIAGAHRLDLPYKSGCRNLHGHNWIVVVHCRSETLNPSGMVEDFAEVKKRIHGKLDHEYFNDHLPFNPTAENIAKWICDQFPSCWKVDVHESEGNIATYEVNHV